MTAAHTSLLVSPQTVHNSAWNCVAFSVGRTLFMFAPSAIQLANKASLASSSSWRRFRSHPRYKIHLAQEWLTHYFLSRYSPGTSSCGTSWVRISLSSVSPASSTPFTTSASNAFPSSSNSSTLSEFAPARLDNPCKSPDCPPERAESPSRAYLTASTVWLFPRTRFFAARLVFPTTFFLGVAFFFFANFFFGAAAFFAGFFLVFFLVAIRAVYHRSAIPGVCRQQADSR